MVINTNLSAENTAQYLAQSSTMLSKSLAELSSGSKVTSPSDDSAGLAVSMSLVAQEGENTAASNNIADALSFNQTQDGYLQQISTALDRMSELSVQAQDVTKSSADIQLYQNEFSSLASYVNNVATENFNGVSLFAGTSLSVTIDATGGSFTMTGVDLTGTTFSGLSSDDLTSDATTALSDVTSAISQLASDRGALGTNEETLTDYQNQLSTLNNNLSAANSTIMDVNVATASTQYAQANILVQAGTAMLAQANMSPQLALKLITG
ncbi:MAG TPA: flagellin [Verrucomicrobiae bacterium]|jgi:flagellin|nr:flagellin [Verrucomicrobiae bacterium]